MFIEELTICKIYLISYIFAKLYHAYLQQGQLLNELKNASTLPLNHIKFVTNVPVMQFPSTIVIPHGCIVHELRVWIFSLTRICILLFQLLIQGHIVLQCSDAHVGAKKST